MPEYATYPGRRGPKLGTMRVGRGGGGGGGEIVQVQGGHIIRATGRKDRHSKVYTAKGPRDRRVRLSAHTAIQFYDVQDRLGYDRPSKAVDWLIKKAKDAIDKLDQLPPFDPTRNNNHHHPAAADSTATPGDLNPNDTAAATDLGMGGGEGNNNNSESSGYEIQQQIHGHHHHQNQIGGGDSNMSAAALSLDSNSMVAETMRSFFPTTTTTAGVGEQMNSMGGFQSYSPHQQQHNPNHGQDLLGLSLHTFNDSEATAHAAFPAGFLATGGSSTPTGWAGDSQPEMGRFSRLLAWSGGGGGGFGAAQGGNNSFLFGERGTFQSSLINHQQPSSIRAWDDIPHHQPSISGMIGGSDGFMAGFCIPTAHHQHHDGINNNKSSSVSTDSSN